MTAPNDMIDHARAALSGLRLPDGSPLLGSPRLSGPVLSGGRVSLAISISVDEADRFAPIRAAAEAALRAAPGGQGALVTLTSERAAPP